METVDPPIASSGLNPSQEKAVVHRGSHLLIVAGPGTGKTHTLTFRIAHLLEEMSGQEFVLAITFTHKAAEEMRSRLARRLGEQARRVFIGTFHQFGLQVLREFSNRAGLPETFKVVGPEDISRLSPEIWPESSLTERTAYLEEVGRLKASSTQEKNARLYEYNSFLRTRQLLDFDDLLLETVQLLQKHDAVRAILQSRYGHVCVDEYQDINEVQHALLELLVLPFEAAAGHGVVGERIGAAPQVGAGGRPPVTLTAIGDPNQAIYGFRGSDVRFFTSFEYDFKPASVLWLSDNYRSAANLLKASAQVIEKQPIGGVPALTAKIILDGQLTIHEAATERAEAHYVVESIEKLMGALSHFSLDSGRGTVPVEGDAHLGFADFAVLYRLNAQRHALEEAFQKSGIPYYTSAQQAKAEAWMEAEGVASIESAQTNYKEKEKESISQKVSLLTFHAAKGLEFKVVFLVGCEENIVPLKWEGLTTLEEEERRLFYVAMTRAKQVLFLVRAKRRMLFGQILHNAASPFLCDIQDELKQIDIAQKLKGKVKQKEKQIDLFEAM